MGVGTLFAVEWFHILFAATWLGSAVFLTFVVWPSILNHPARESRVFFDAFNRRLGPLMNFSGRATLTLGIVRGTWLGQIRSWNILFTTSYGLTWLTALLTTLVVIVYGGKMGRELPRLVWNGDAYRPGAQKEVWTRRIFALACFAIILVCMVLMHLGL